MFSLLFPSKRFDSRMNHVSEQIRSMNMRIELLERVVSNQTATISRLTKGQESTHSTKDPISGKVPAKAASAPRSGGLRSGAGSFRSGSSKPGSGASAQHYNSHASAIADDPTPSYHHSHGHHHHSGGDTGGYDSGCSDSSPSFSGCD